MRWKIVSAADGIRVTAAMAPTSRLFCAVIVIALACFQSATSRNINETIYMVTMSSQVVGGSQATLCAQVHGPTEPLTLAVSFQLAKPSAKTTVLEKRIVKDFYSCVEFQVFPVVSETVATLYVSVTGRRESMTKESKILIRPSSLITIVQTDKPIYKPGQKVQFRVVSLDSSFVPYNQRYRTVELQDPNSNRIAQWLNQLTVSGILDLSHPTTPEAPQGRYTITTWNENGMKTDHSFDIKEYVLPKYEVTIQLPSVITILDTKATLAVCGKYTYGKPVMGSVKVEICRKKYTFWRPQPDELSDICMKYKMRTDKSGCVTQVVDVTQFKLDMTGFQDSFDVQAEMEEDGTEVIQKSSASVSFSSVIRMVTFDAPTAFKAGLLYQGEIKMTGPDSSPVVNEPVYLILSYSSTSLKWTLMTDSKGMASFSLDTTLWTDSVNLQARARPEENEGLHNIGQRNPDYITAYLNPTAFYSKSKSFLSIQQASQPLSCEADATVGATYIIQGAELKMGQQTLSFFYMVMSRGSLVQYGRMSVKMNGRRVNKGDVTVKLQKMKDLTPIAQVVVYTVMPSGEVVADSQNVPIQLCLKNKVSLKFSSLQELPGEKTSLSLQAQPGSLCSVRAIDQSVLLLQPEQELSIQSVFQLLPVDELSGYNYNLEDDEPYPCRPMPVPIMPVPPPVKPVARLSRSKPFIYYPGQNLDVYSVFKHIGIKILTNSDVRRPYDCSFWRFEPLAPNVPRPGMIPEGVKEKAGGAQEIVRTFFPETWIWDLVPVGNSGSVTLQKTVPDTITKWAAGAFCTSPVGLGLAPDTGLTAFQPFFLSLTLPYSVIRGEVFILRATVFNYLPKCIMVKVTLQESNQFSAKPCKDCQYQLCLCADESRTFQWIVTPTALGEVSLKVSAEALRTRDLCNNKVVTVPERGRIDTVISPLLVEAEGTQVTESHNALLCPAEGPVEKHISLKLPLGFVEGSAKASVSVLGDLMGRAMKNLDSLLAMPYGCGEQNMILFAPNIYILLYLQSTRQLTPEIQAKAKVFLESGYQRELNYKHDDGSYSAFGMSDESGNTWLTTFVMKSFGGAQPYIFVDPAYITKAKSWLASHQKPDGCIASVGKLFHDDLKGGVSDDVSLTAYIAAALLELGHDTSDPMVKQSLGCLRKSVSSVMENLYTTALFSYTFTLAGDKEMRSKLITFLHQKATVTDGTRHWKRDEASGKGVDSIEVEMTSYVLLALLSGPAMKDFGLDYSSSIVRWLAQQQNPYGGFASTQDTVVALQALAKYGAATFSPEGATTVVVTSAGGWRKEFKVDQSNRLLYQESPLGEVPGEYKIRAEGKGCVFLQMALRYNIPPRPNLSAFNIDTKVAGVCNTAKPSLTVTVNVRYNGQQKETNMVIIDIKLLSGFIPNETSLEHLRGANAVKRVDEKEGHILIYLAKLKQKETQSYIVVIQEDQPVSNIKPAVVMIYDYYQIDVKAVSKYSSPCAGGQ